MKNQFCFVLGILIGVIFVFAVSVSHGAEYSKNDDAFQEAVEEEEIMSYIYYEIKIDSITYRCKSYELNNGKITMYNVFMESSDKKYSEFMIMNSISLDYIKKKKALSENKVIKTHSSECFINTARGK